MNKKYQHFATNAIRTQHERAFREHSVPLYITSSFTFDDAEQARALFADEYVDNIYSRFSNPNVNEFVEKMCVLEDMEDGFGTATGMAAVFASIMPFLKTGRSYLSFFCLVCIIYQNYKRIFAKMGHRIFLF
jgi:O-succinylhomoserine sulfhydrylase